VNCPHHPQVRLELVNATTGERTCPACALVPTLAAPPLPIAACAHLGDRQPYRPEHGMELCSDCGCTVAVRKP